MIKGILIGGGDLSPDVLNKIKEESVVGFSKDKSIKVLVIPFARYKEDWDSVYMKNTKKYNHDDFVYDYIRASENNNELLSQLNTAEIVIVPGGSEISLAQHLPILDKKYLDNKVIIATSAGTNYFSTSYYSNDRNEFSNGRGIFRINTICHFKQETISKVSALIELNNVPTFPLREGEFIVVYE